MGSLKFFVRGIRVVAYTGVDRLYDSETRWKQWGEGKGGGMSKKNVLVMKCNKNVNIPYCGKYPSMNTG